MDGLNRAAATLVLCALAGCGRIGFESQTASDGGASPDAGPREEPCERGFVRVETGGACRRVLFQDDFEDGVIGPEWRLMRTQFEERDGRLYTVPAPRSGFDYGHEGNGRSPLAFVHIGDTQWTDYRLQLKIAHDGVSPAWNPYGITDCTRAIGIWVRAQEYPESWNEPGVTAYGFGATVADCGDGWPLGDWGVSREHDVYQTGIGGRGFGGVTGQSYSVFRGNAGDMIHSLGQKYVIEVRGSRIAVAAGDTLLVDDVDDVPFDIGGTPITHGGFGVGWVFEGQGWIDDVLVVE